MIPQVEAVHSILVFSCPIQVLCARESNINIGEIFILGKSSLAVLELG